LGFNGERRDQITEGAPGRPVPKASLSCRSAPIPPRLGTFGASGGKPRLRRFVSHRGLLRHRRLDGPGWGGHHALLSRFSTSAHLDCGPSAWRDRPGGIAVGAGMCPRTDLSPTPTPSRHPGAAQGHRWPHERLEHSTFLTGPAGSPWTSKDSPTAHHGRSVSPFHALPSSSESTRRKCRCGTPWRGQDDGPDADRYDPLPVSHSQTATARTGAGLPLTVRSPVRVRGKP
jgi:hypothetical protein